MDGEQNGATQTQQDAAASATGVVGASKFEAQIAETSKNAETADGFCEEIAALKRRGADERVEFSLLLCVCGSVPTTLLMSE